jgi:glucose/arabinose dehydrogenase
VPLQRSAVTIAGMNKLKSFSLLFCLFLFEPGHAELNLDMIELLPGFKIEIYAEGVENARQMVLGDQGTVFVGSRRAGKLWAVSDSDGDQYAEQVRLIDEDLKMPSGLEFKNGALYVGALERVLRYDNIESRLDQPPVPVVVTDSLPDKE